MKNKRILSLAIASALGLLAPVTVNAFGLGKIEINSALNEPFSAEIPLTALKSGESQNLQVRLASNEEFEKAGLERNFILTDFTFDIVKNSSTDVVIKVTSNKSVREPLLDFLLTATSGNGRLIREYTVLLDPPTHVLAKPQTQQVISSPLPDVKVEPEEKPLEQAAKLSRKVMSSEYSNNDYGVTTSTDTLWNIAKKVRPTDEFSMNQMMIALLNENPSAFRNQNINGLKKGYRISVPSSDAISAISKKEANNAVRQQNEQWKNRNSSVTSPVNTATQQSLTPNQIDTNDESETGEQTTSAVIGSTADTDATLSLVTPSQGEQVSDDASSQIGDEKLQNLTEQLTFAQETIEAQAQQSIEIESRMAAMEEQLETMRRLISLKDADLARLQSLLEDEQQNDPSFDEQLETVVENTVEGTQNIVENLESALDGASEAVLGDEAESQQPDTNSLQDDSIIESQMANSDEATQQEINQVEQVSDSDTVIKTIADITGAEPEVVSGLSQQISEFVSKNKVPMSLAGVLLLVILLLLFRRKTNDDTDDEAEPQVVVPVTTIDDEAEGDVIDDTTTDSNVDDAKDIPVKTAADLIEQADVFVGYADYAQARTSLEQARFIEPENVQAVSKLLFVLYKQQQTDKFIQLIEDSGIEQSGSEWQEIEEWGKELAPEHELFMDPVVVEESIDVADDLPEADESLEVDSSSESEEAGSVSVEQEDSYLEFDASDYQVDEETVENEDISSDLETESILIDETVEAENDQDVSINFSAESDVQTNEPGLTIDATETSLNDLDDSNLVGGLDTSSEADDLDLTVTLGDEELSSTDEADLSLDIDESESTSNLEFSLDIDDNSEANDRDSNDLSLDDSLSFEIDQLDEQQLDSDDTDVELDISSDTEFDSDELSSSGSELEFDLDNFDEIDEAETKLDLAVAYIDMGDPDGARSILDEVITDGNDEQKNRAQDLLDTIS